MVFEVDWNKVIKKLEKAVNEIEWNTFSTGFRIIGTGLSEEELIKLKSDLNHQFRIKIVNAFNKEPVKENFDLYILYDFLNDEIKVNSRPVYLLGNYKKLIRGIPQTKWPCRTCNGNGCSECNYTGKQYLETVEELIGNIVLNAFQAEKEKFHGAGREDIDAKMLGSGRPFVLEIIEPKKRLVNLKALEKEINEKNNGKIEVIDLRFTDKKKIVELKNTSYNKQYLAITKFEAPLTQKMIEKLNSINNLKLNQFTPKRVSHRRALLERKKIIFEVKAKKLSEKEAELLISAEHGTYIKEFISGDQGRTKPSVSSLLENNAKCIELNVLKIFN